jgi:hypothetical protein
MADIDIGEMFLNFILHADVRPYPKEGPIPRKKGRYCGNNDIDVPWDSLHHPTWLAKVWDLLKK